MNMPSKYMQIKLMLGARSHALKVCFALLSLPSDAGQPCAIS